MLLPYPLLRRAMPFQHEDSAITYRPAHPYPFYGSYVSSRTGRTPAPAFAGFAARKTCGSPRPEGTPRRRHGRAFGLNSSVALLLPIPIVHGGSSSLSVGLRATYTTPPRGRGVRRGSILYRHHPRLRSPVASQPSATATINRVVLHRSARTCKAAIAKPNSFLCLAQCCPKLRSRWCQSGVRNRSWN